MSVRRLAEDTVQPAAFAFNEENAAWAEATIRKYPDGRQQSAVIPLLMRAQEQDGWVTRAALEYVAQKLDMPYIRVLEVATFYTQFQLKPVGTRAHIQVCGTTPCMLRGAEDLIRVCKSKIHAEPLTPNEDGTLSWEEVECQGACVNAPMIMIFKDTYEDLTPTQLEHIIDRFQAGKGSKITPGPQVDRHFSAPVGGATTLTDETASAKAGPASDPQETGSGAKVPPADAARPKDRSPLTDPTIKTPATDRNGSRKQTRAAELQPLSATASTPKPDRKRTGSTAQGAPAEAGAVSGASRQKPAAARKASLEDKNRPKAIDRPDAVDDLKLISGVGPKVEATLHELGIFTFSQIAGWKKAEREWVDGYLNFKGRIDRDDWVRQAKALAKGGEAEYIKVFGKKPR